MLQLVRRTPRTADEHRWDPQHRRIDDALLADVDAVINLAGAAIRPPPVDQRLQANLLTAGSTRRRRSARRWPRRRRRPVASRVLLNASAVGYYGDTGDRDRRPRRTPPGTDFLAQLCVAVGGGHRAGRRGGRARGAPAHRAGPRPDGDARPGAGPALPARASAGASGSGRQYWPWISLRDEIGAIRHLLVADVPGPVNLTAPDAGDERGVHRSELGRVLHRPTLLPVPASRSARARGVRPRRASSAASGRVPAKLQDSGYAFSHTDLAAALPRRPSPGR